MAKDRNVLYAHLSASHHFVPFAMETLGVLGHEALSLLEDIGRRIRVETGEPQSFQFLLQGVLVAIQRGNAASVLGTANVIDNVFILLMICFVSLGSCLGIS